MIDQVTIERILDAAEITEVISDFVNLRRRGVNYLGLCPFHNEKTPSFTVSPSKGIFKCFGCGKGGNVVNFIMEHETLSYPDALKFLARKYHIDVVEKEETEEERQLKDDRESMMIVSGFAQKYFSRYMWEESEGIQVGLSYFRERGFREDILRKFEVGYAPDGKTIFTEAAQKEGYQPEYLEKSGLTIKRDDWIRDRFAGRVMFPIHNMAGRVIGFGGRILKDKAETAKYLNSPESEIYHKSRVVYGIFQAKKEIARADKCFLVEGYTDVLSLHQSGIENVVASSGTALTSDQIRLIRRFSTNITILFDGDEAGIKASLRGIDLILEEGMNVKVVLLPPGEDPDSFARKQSSSELLKYIGEHETDFIRFKTSLLVREVGNDPIARARLINEVIRSVAVIPDQIARSVYIRECSRLLDVEESILYSEVRKHLRSRGGQIPLPSQDTPRQGRGRIIQQHELPTEELNTQELELIRFLLKYCNVHVFEKEGENPEETVLVTVADFFIEGLLEEELISDKPVFKTIIMEIAEKKDDSGFQADKYFVYHPDVSVSAVATELLSEKWVESKRWEKAGASTETEIEALGWLIPKIWYEFKIMKTREKYHYLEQQLEEAQNKGDEKALFEIFEDMKRVKFVEKQLSDKLGNRTFI